MRSPATNRIKALGDGAPKALSLNNQGAAKNSGIVFVSQRAHKPHIVKSAKRGHIWSPLPLMRPQTALRHHRGSSWPRTRTELRLLVHQFPPDPTGTHRAKHAGVHTDTADRRHLQTVFPALLVIPGVAAAVLFRKTDVTFYDQALPFLMQHYYGQALLGLGISAILASLMSGLAGNISALSALWTHDLYRSHINPRCKRSTLSDDGTDSSSKLLCVDLLCPRTRSNDC